MFLKEWLIAFYKAFHVANDLPEPLDVWVNFVVLIFYMSDFHMELQMYLDCLILFWLSIVVMCRSFKIQNEGQ